MQDDHVFLYRMAGQNPFIPLGTSRRKNRTVALMALSINATVLPTCYALPTQAFHRAHGVFTPRHTAANSCSPIDYYRQRWHG
ncbi:MAG: hypothetical protein AAF821_22775 [Cyanobacteria bacterium P01_D01_bin.156]